MFGCTKREVVESTAFLGFLIFCPLCWGRTYSALGVLPVMQVGINGDSLLWHLGYMRSPLLTTSHSYLSFVHQGLREPCPSKCG